MKKRLFKFLLASVFCGFYTLVATAATSLFSDYGQIQNVQNYSSNPFWSPNSPYNQRQPQPVYVQGTDLNTEDCIKVVQPLVAVQCAARDNCKNTQLADIRPAIMVQLSNLPGHNYVSACSGFIDGIFDSYVAQYGNSIPNRQVAFPTATFPNPTVTTPTPTVNTPSTAPQIQNPYKAPTPQWQQEMDERSRELEELQRENSAGNNELSATAFPETYADLSFSAKTGLLKDSYEPYEDLNAYVEFGDILSEDEYCSGNENARGCEKYKARAEETNNKNNNAPKKNNATNQKPTAQGPAEYVMRIRKRMNATGLRQRADGNPDTDGKGCYAACGQAITDNVNNKAINPVMGKYYCARTSDGLLVENDNRSNVLKMTKDQLDKIKSTLASSVADKDKCDGNFREFVVFIGKLDKSGAFIQLDQIVIDK